MTPPVAETSLVILPTTEQATNFCHSTNCCHSAPVYRCEGALSRSAHLRRSRAKLHGLLVRKCVGTNSGKSLAPIKSPSSRRCPITRLSPPPFILCLWFPNPLPARVSLSVRLARFLLRFTQTFSVATIAGQSCISSLSTLTGLDNKPFTIP